MNILTAEQIAFYQEQGYLALPGFIGEDWLERLNAGARWGKAEQSPRLPNGLTWKKTTGRKRRARAG